MAEDSGPGALERIYQRLAAMERKGGADRVWDIATKAAVPAVIVLVGTMITHEVRLSVIESNRFTDQDARKLEKAIMQSPEWLRSDLAEIKLSQHNIEDRLRVLEQKVR